MGVIEEHQYVVHDLPRSPPLPRAILLATTTYYIRVFESTDGTDFSVYLWDQVRERSRMQGPVSRAKARY